MILIAFGANLPGPHGQPEDTIAAACRAFPAYGIEILKFSSLWLTEPVPPAPGQSWYRNAVASVRTTLNVRALLVTLKQMERDFGRAEGVVNAPRVLDLDLLAYNDEVLQGAGLAVPHPRMHERGFVLYPLREIAPDWIHPLMKKSAAEMAASLPPGQGECRLLAKAA